MCGRYNVLEISNALLITLGLDDWVDPDWIPRQSIAPGQWAPIIGMGTTSPSIQKLFWGFKPNWDKNPEIRASMFNSRIETLTERPSFKHTVDTQRCLIPITGFFEKDKKSTGSPSYNFQHTDHKTFCLAGIHDTWRHENTTLHSFSMITGAPNASISDVHSRMPVAVPSEHYHLWLNRTVPFTAAKELLANQPMYSRYQVSPEIWKTKAEDIDDLLAQYDENQGTLLG